MTDDTTGPVSEPLCELGGDYAGGGGGEDGSREDEGVQLREDPLLEGQVLGDTLLNQTCSLYSSS